MSRKIKLHSLHFLFQIFSFLADKSGGWKLFVKPKLIIGSLILGLGFTACNAKNDSTSPNSKTDPKTNESQKKDSLIEPSDPNITCYIIVKQEHDSNSIYEIVEEEPHFFGGDKALIKYLSSELRYPSSAAKNKIEGRVICRFVIEKDGSIGQLEVVRPVEPSLDKEAVRVIKCMPKWIPGKADGKVVRSWFVLPINFKLQ